MNYGFTYSGLKQSGASGLQQFDTQNRQETYQTSTIKQQIVTTESANWASTQLLGKVEDKDFMVVQRSRTYEKSEPERQHHYEELIQDNLRMREVIEQLKREVASYKANSSSDVSQLRKELMLTQQELDAAQKELMLLRSGAEQKNRSEMDKLLAEIEEWRKKCSLLEQKEKENAEALKQLAYYQNKLRLNELEAKKKFEKYQTVDLLSQQLSDQEALIEELRMEIQRWKDKYDSLTLESQEIRLKLSSNNKVSELQMEIEALLHEIDQWKQRCRALELRVEQSEESKLLARIEQLNRMLGEKDQEMQRTRMTMSQQIAMSQQNKMHASQSQINDYENQLEQLRRQLEQAQSKIAQNEKDMEGFKLSSNVYNSERFDELEQEKWKLELQIEELEKDCDTFMLRIKELETSFSELQIKFNEQNADYMKYKEIVDANSSKFKTQENLMKELSTLQQELEVWKNRYFQTEIRLKEYDQLRIEYDALLKQGQISKVTTINIETDSQYISVKRERDTYFRQVQELEQRIREIQSNSLRSSQDNQLRRERDNYIRQIEELEYKISQLQTSQSQTIKYVYDESKTRELESQISEYKNKIQSYESRITVYETRIREIETKQKEYEVRNTQSLVEKTVVMTDEPKIKELTAMIQQKNQRILELEQQGGGTNTVVIIREQIRIKELRIRELETQVETLQLEVERLQNLKRDQETRINIMIQKITEYESQVNMLQEAKIRQSKRSPSQQQQIISTTVIGQPQPTVNYVQNTSASKVQTYQTVQQINPVSQSYTYQPLQQQQTTTTTTRQVIINDSSKNLYPQEDNVSSQIVDRIGVSTSKVASYTSQTMQQQPQIIVSQYKPTN